MAVMTRSSKTIGTNEQHFDTQKQSFYKTRPITATLDHPLILDIKLLKKLDMTTFTKKGLIALSKFCGISLIKKSDSKRKHNKSTKNFQSSKKQLKGDNSLDVQHLSSVKKIHTKIKRNPVKQIAKIKPRINLKILDEANWLEDSGDAIRKRQEKVMEISDQTEHLKEKGTKEKTPVSKKKIINYLFNNTIENVIPEPCKSCTRSEFPERLHSHPKVFVNIPDGSKNDKIQSKSAEKTNLDEKCKSSVTTKDYDENRKWSSGSNNGNKNLCAKENCNSLAGSPQKRISSFEDQSGTSPSHHTPSSESLNIPSGVNIKKNTTRKTNVSNSSDTKLSDSTKNKQTSKKMDQKNSTPQKETEKVESVPPVGDAIEYITGCYVCGKQISPKLRIKHEEECIAEWRARNSLLSPNKRKPEPKRPDYRFTASGDVDCQGTFESIWANHMDSLVPCKKCGRTFFPDRIEKHETCCNNLPFKVKYKH